jgi:hypothetical protein
MPGEDQSRDDDPQWSEGQIDATANQPWPEQPPVIDGIADVSQDSDLFPLDAEYEPGDGPAGITIMAATIQRGTLVAMLNASRKFLGMGESPAGSNWNAIVDWFNKHIAKIGRGAWCDMSVTKAAYDSGCEVPVLGGGGGRGFAYVPAHMAWGRAKYGIHYGSVPPAGAIVGYRWDRRKGSTICDHIGISEKDNRDGTFYSLEGNTGDAYKRQHRDLTYVSCWWMPGYASASAPATPKVDPDCWMG